ncbi:MAG TPA: Mth938-like domain-containing protein [Methylophilaceae bacterium]|jgi:uncharacterized protein
MKLHLTQAEGNQLITAYERGTVSINHQRYQHSVMVLPTEVITDWQMSRFDDLNADDFVRISSYQPEVVLLGTGETHRFIHPKLTVALTNKGIPVECMTTDAACRTYNILMSEGRKVLAALIV